MCGPDTEHRASVTSPCEARAMTASLMPDAVICGVQAEIPAEVVDQLTAIPDGEWEVLDTVACEIQLGHAGSHVALCESEDETYEDGGSSGQTVKPRRS